MVVLGSEMAWGQTEITALSQITDADGNYIITADISGGTPGVTTFNGTLTAQAKADGTFPVISGLSAPLFTTATNATISNIILDQVNISQAGITGSIACTADGTTSIYNCGILSGSVGSTGTSSGDNKNDCCGGLVGFLDGTARVINCYSYATITGGNRVGGIVGYNNFQTTSASDKLKTMVMNCMFYGDITGGQSKAPIYHGKKINNIDAAGVGNYNYFSAEASYVKNNQIDMYYCALMAETRFLQRFEFYRYLLNSHRELAAWWATGDRANKDLMAKWVLETADRTISNPKPYPILKAQRNYPSIINYDAKHAPRNASVGRNKGVQLGTLTVNIQKGSGGAQFNNTDATITTSQLKLIITDKDYDHFNYNYYKVRLPYYNDVGTGNYTNNRVVTGWKIVSIVGGTPGTFTTGAYDAVTDDNGNITSAPYNFADRYCTNKDLYGTNGSNRVFNQGAYWDVPEGVTEITIEPYWAKAAYVADEYADIVYNTNMTTPYNVPNVGGGQIYTNGTSTFNGTDQKVYTSIGNAVTALNPQSSHTVNDYAVVLVGNYHEYSGNGTTIRSGKPYTVTSVDLDRDNEPDYSFIWRFDGRTKLHPVKYDFLNLIGFGMAQKSTGGKGSYNFGIPSPLDWFEVTNTALFRVTQMEYSPNNRAKKPIIMQGGVIEQWVTQQQDAGDRVQYFHVGSNVWFKEFHRGSHQDNAEKSTPHPPLSVTGGDYEKFYLTGAYQPLAKNYNDDAECYINGGRFGTVAGAGMEGIGDATNHTKGNIIWQIDNADINEFFGGGLNGEKSIQGNITTIIRNSHVELFCGGPKFGDMNSGRTVKTTATKCHFGTYFGAGYGGNSYYRAAPANFNSDKDPWKSTDDKQYNLDWNRWIAGEIKSNLNSGTYPGGIAYNGYNQDYISDFGGVSVGFDYQFLPMSNNTANVARLFIDFVSFSLATTHNVTSNLTGCTITGNFYGGGSLGAVSGPVTSTLTGCTVDGNVFGAGYSASLPTVSVMPTTGFKVEPNYDKNTGVFIPGELPDPEPDVYHWQHAETVSSTETAIDKENHILYTTESLDGLGVVSGNVILTLNNSTVGSQADTTNDQGNVFGGGEQSSVEGNTTVTINGGNIYGSIFGGGDLGSVGTFTTDGVGKPISCAENTGKCTVEVKGAVNIGHDNMTMPHDWGHVFGAGRGTVDPEAAAKVGGDIDHVAYVDYTEVTIGEEDGAIDASPLVKGSVYGGSENGHVLHNTKVKINSGQIGVGKNQTTRYTAQQWNSNSLKPCASWEYVDNGVVYDPYTPEGGWDDEHINLRPSSRTATDGHTYYGNVFGGGSGVIPYAAGEWKRASGIVEGNTEVVINGGHILTSVYGGNEQTDVLGTTSVEMNGGTVGVPRTKDDILENPALCYVFGGGKGDKRIKFNTWTNVSSTSVVIKGGTVYGSVYGGGEDGHVLGDAVVSIEQAENKTVRIGCDGTSGYDGNVFGGGQGSSVAQTAGVISGNVTVDVKGGTMYGSVYGGGRIASVGTYLVPDYVTTKYGRLIPDGYEQVVTDDGSADDIVVEGTKHGEITMTVEGGTIKGNVFGAGKGDRDTRFNTWTNVKSTSLTINGGTIEGSVFGGGEDGHVLRDAVTSIDPAESKTIVIGKDDEEDNGNVFGGGQGSTTALTAGVVSGNVTLDIKGGTMYGSVYGGGRLASVGTFLVPPTDDDYGTFIPDDKEQIVINDGPGDTEDAPGRKHGNITVDLTGGTIHGNVFGGGMGSTDDEHGTADRLGISKNVQLDLNKEVPTTGVKGCVVLGSIFGCNNMNASPKGTVEVHIHATQNNAATQIANTSGDSPVTDAKQKGVYDVQAVYGGGNMAAYVPTDLENGKTNVIIDGCQFTSIRQVYGGGNAASVPATEVQVNGTYEIEEVFGGGNGLDDIIVGGETKPNPGANVGYKNYTIYEKVDDDWVAKDDPAYDTKEERTAEGSAIAYGTGAANVNINGGTIHRVFGGSNTKGNVRITAVTMLEDAESCEFCVDEAYGGGKSAPMDAEAKLLMACIPGLKEAYGGAEEADIMGDVTLTITNGTFDRVFGGNNLSGTISGKITVNVEETGCRPIIIGELYGGGNLAAYSIYGYNADGTPKESGDDPFDDPVVNVRSFTSIGTVYGGGYGVKAVMVGSPTVNINESLGTPDTYPTTGDDYDAEGFKGKTITLDAGKSTEHTVTLPAHKRGKIGAIGNVFGGGNAAEVKGNTTVNIGTLSENTFVSLDDDSSTTETDESKLPVVGADIRENVYGGGNNAKVTGNTNVVIGKAAE